HQVVIVLHLAWVLLRSDQVTVFLRELRCLRVVTAMGCELALEVGNLRFLDVRELLGSNRLGVGTQHRGEFANDARSLVVHSRVQSYRGSVSERKYLGSGLLIVG